MALQNEGGPAGSTAAKAWCLLPSMSSTNAAKKVTHVGERLCTTSPIVSPTAPTTRSSVPAFLGGKITLLYSGEHVMLENRFLPFTISAPPPSFQWINKSIFSQAEATTSAHNLVLLEASVISLYPMASSPSISTTVILIRVQLEVGDARRQRQGMHQNDFESLIGNEILDIGGSPDAFPRVEDK